MVKKLINLSQCAAIRDSSTCTFKTRCSIIDLARNNKFLLNTGAEISCIHASVDAAPLTQLNAINQTSIAVYGTKKLAINLGFDDLFEWKFQLADVPVGILGMDFLAYHKITIAPETCSATHKPSGRTLAANSALADIFCIFNEFPQASSFRSLVLAQLHSIVLSPTVSRSHCQQYV